MGMEGGPDSKRCAELREKLDALNYLEELHPPSIPLVDHLLADLVQTTESHRSLKVKNAKLSQELEVEKHKCDILQKDNARLLSENNRLHFRILNDAEEFSATERARTQSWKRMEDEVASLQFYRSQLEERMKIVESERDSLQSKLQELVQLASDHLPEDASKMDVRYFGHINVPGSQNPRGAKASSAPSLVHNWQTQDSTRPSDVRSQQLEKDLSEMKERQTDLTSLLALAEEKLSLREAEIRRLLGLLEGGRSMDQLMLEHRHNEAVETIATLNHQVDYLSSQLSASEECMAEKQKLEKMVQQLRREKADLDDSLKEAMAENVKVYEEVRGIQDLIQKLQAQPPAPDHSSREGVSAEESQLEQLRRAREGLLGRLDELKQTVAFGEKEQRRLQETCQQLQTRSGRLETAVVNLEREKVEASECLAEMKMHLEEERDKCKALGSELQQRQEEVHARERQANAYAESAQKLEEDLQEERAVGLTLRQSLKAAREASQEHETAIERLQKRQEELLEQVQHLEMQVNVISADREELQETIKGLRQEKIRLTAELQAAEEDRDRHKRITLTLREDLNVEKAKGERMGSSYVHHDLQLSKASAEVEALKAENNILREQVAQTSTKLSKLESDQLAHSIQCEHTDNLQPRIQQLQKRVEELEAQALEKELVLVRARSELTAKVDELKFVTAEKGSLEETLERSQMERNEMAEEVKEYDARLRKSQAALMTATAERDASLSLQAKLAQDLEDLRAREQELKMAARSSAAAMDKVERKCASLERQLAGLEEEKTQAAKHLAHVHQVSEASHSKEDDLRRKTSSLLHELEVSHSQNAQLLADIDDIKEEQARERAKMDATSTDLQQCRQQLAEAERDIEQLKTLITQLDATREELMGKLRSSLADRRLVESQVATLEHEKEASEEELDRLRQESSKLQSLVGELDTERDHMQSEVDLRSEEIKRLQQECATWQDAAVDAKRCLGVAEGRLQATETSAKELDAEVQSMREQLSLLQERLRLGQEECAMKTDELRRLGEDLAAVTREHQAVVRELNESAGSCASLDKNLRETAAKLAFAEQMIHAKEKEMSEMLRSLQKLGEENQQNAMAAEQAEFQIHTYRLQQVGLEESIRSAHEHIKGLEDENMRYVNDLQTLEQQADSLSRSLTQQAQLLEDQQKEKAALLSQLAASKQVAMELELSRNTIQRDLAAAEARLRTLQMRLGEGEKERDSLTARYTMEQNRIKELEQLVACMRVQGHHADVVHQDSGSRTANLMERLQAAEKQVAALQLQVHTLQTMRDVQSREIARLQAAAKGLSVEAGSRAVVSATSADAAESVQPVTAGERGRIQALEGRAVSLAGELAKVTAKFSDCRLQLQKAEAMYRSVREENERMFVLLSKMDEERTQLQDQNPPGSSRASPEHSRQADAGPSVETLKGECARLRIELDASEDRRKSAERNFEELMATVEGLPLEPGIRGVVRQPIQLQASVEDLRKENAVLRERLAATVSSYSDAEVKLRRVQREYTSTMGGAAESAPQTPRST